MATYTKCTAGVEPLLEAINAGSDAWKIALTTPAPTALTTFVAGTDDLTTGNGYTAGGNAASTTSATQSGGTYSLTLANPATWTASGAGIGPFRYAVLVDSTTNTPVGFWDYGSSISLSGANGDTFAFSFSGAAITVS